MQNLITQLTEHLTYLVASGLAGFLTWLVTKAKYEAKSAIKDAVATRKGLLSLLRGQITEYRELHQNGGLDTSELYKVESLYSAYKELGGNGIIDHMAKEMKITQLGGNR